MMTMTQTSDNGIGRENGSATEVEVVALPPQAHLHDHRHCHHQAHLRHHQAHLHDQHSSIH